ncbi:MAG: hypothetical protein RLY61_508 [Candidatus Parcubacteria bacterium]|jgi:8-oxo-dGTP pyrophosphatase MutT (NUDIX family)
MPLLKRSGQEHSERAPSNETLMERAATVVIFLVGSEGKEYIMLLHKDTASRDDWEIPGGTVEKKETTQDTIIREVLEEAGVTVKNYELHKMSDVLSHLGVSLNSSGKTIQSKVLLAYLLAQNLEELAQGITLGEEHSEYVLIQRHNTRGQDYREMHGRIVKQLRTGELRLVHIQDNIWQVQSSYTDATENKAQQTLKLSEVTADALLAYESWDLGRM